MFKLVYPIICRSCKSISSHSNKLNKSIAFYTKLSNYCTVAITSDNNITLGADILLYKNVENVHIYNILIKSIPTLKAKPSSNQFYEDVETPEQFHNVLRQNFRQSSATTIVNVFKSVQPLSLRLGTPLSDERFDGIVDGLMDQCENLTDDELFDLLNCLCMYPLSESYQAHNFHDVWSCLDDICRSRLNKWETHTALRYANVWYKLHLAKFCNFVYDVVDSKTNRPKRLTKEEMLHLCFLINAVRNFTIPFQFEEIVVKYAKECNADQLAIVGLAYFKTKSKIKMLAILEIMMNKIIEEASVIDEKTLTPLLKILRFSKIGKLYNNVSQMLDHLTEQVDRLSPISCVHIGLMGTTTAIYHKDSVIKCSQKVAQNISNVSKVRVKDLERIILPSAMFDIRFDQKPDIFDFVLEEIQKERRKEEFIKFPRCLLSTLNYLSFRGLYSYELMNMVLDEHYIQEVYGKATGSLPRELLLLDCCIDIECLDFEGSRLSPALRYRLAKWNTDIIPSANHWKKPTQADKLFFDVHECVIQVVKDKKLVHLAYPLPHYSKADIILCKNKDSNTFVEPVGFQNYVLGDVIPTGLQKNLKWYAVIPVCWNNTIRNTSLLLGTMTTKQRQLTKLGYEPVFVIWNEFMHLPLEKKHLYIKLKIFK